MRFLEPRHRPVLTHPLRRVARLRALVPTVLIGLLWASGAGAELTLLETIPLNDTTNGKQPWGIAFSATRQQAYIACIDGPSHLMVIDGASGTIAARVPLSGAAPHGICFNADEARLFVANFGGSVSFIDAAVPEELFTVTLDGAPVDLCCYQPAGAPEVLYVTEMYGARLFVLNAENGAVLDTIDVGADPYDLCLNRTTDRLYVTNLSDGTVSVIDVTADTTMATIAVGAYPIGVAVDEELDLIYVCHRDDNTVGVIDGATQTLTATYPVGESPRNVAIDPATHRIFVANALSNDVTLLLPGGPTGASAPAGQMPSGGIAVDPISGQVFVTNAASDDVTRFNVSAPWEPLTVRLRFAPGTVALWAAAEPPDPVFVANAQGNDIAHLNTSVGALARTLNCGYAPVDLATRYNDNLLVTISAETNCALLIDGTTGAAIDTFPVGNNPRGICCREDRPEIYVANWDSGSLSIINTDVGLITDTILFTGGPVLDVAVSTSADRIYASRWNGLVHILDGTTHATIDSIHVSGFYEVNRLAVDEARHFIYATALNANVVWVLSDPDHAVIGTVPLAALPTGVAVNADLQHAYACAGSELVQIGSQHSVEATLTLPGSLARCAADPLSRRVYVTGSTDGGGYLAIILDGDLTAVPELPPAPVLTLRLHSGNPLCSSGAAIRFYLENEIPAHLDLYGLDGRRLRRLGSANEFSPGTHLVAWDRRDAAGQPVSAGTYFLRAHSAGAASAGLRLVLLP